MKLSFKILSTVNFPRVQEKIEGATKGAVKDLITGIANDSIKGSPYLTGHNRRSIKYEIKKMAGSVFSTSGYGGFLETGTSRMPARPYFKPALDKNIRKFPGKVKAKMEAPGL